MDDNSKEVEEFELHRSVFNNDLKKLTQILKNNKEIIDKKDKHGNTALYLATATGRIECVCILLKHNATVNIKNCNGWTPLSEAISFGNRQMIEVILKKLKEQTRKSLSKRKESLKTALTQINDFYMELKWEFSSWVPLISKILPNDVCKIYKLGSKIRLDSTLIDFNEMKWERGNISFLFCGDNETMITALDNEAKVYQYVRTQESEAEIQDEIDILMMSDIVTANFSTKNVSFTQVKTGWFFREDKKETIAGQYKCDLYHVNGLTLEQRKRREHLNRDDLQKNKTSIVESLTKSQVIDPNVEIPRRMSLKPPPAKAITFEEYINSEIGNYPALGRELVFKRSQKQLKATVAMCSDFPLSLDTLLNVFEVIAPLKHFSKLRDFISLKLPKKGFPISVHIPIIPTVSAKITFQDFEFRNNIPEELFDIPDNYTLDETRFPDL
ncbi:ankyrin repeat domain-containing protein 13C [Chironomus tepperi]|uniref:ankyrin repeat domain-containing protein 13C n=1 Tax=Chironomus tepperi TaxID=113505 RepID=UPI00391F2909